MASNAESKFSSIRLALDDTITITGIKFVPETLPRSVPSPATPRPLIVCFHGATCSAHYFDLGPGIHTISTAAEMASAPVISINRPGYLDSTALRIPEGSTYHQTLGRFYHSRLFPRLWHDFGEPNHCTGIVLLAHSLGFPGIIISSALHAQDSQPRYPLAGIISSGWGCRFASNMPAHLPPSPTPSEKLTWKRTIMLDDPDHDCAPPDARTALELQDQPNYSFETDEIRSGAWRGSWRDFSDRIDVPIMWGVAEYDRFFEGSLQHLREYEAMFPSCPRFDANLVLGAPHAIEWSYMALGWYMRCLGFAIETCVWAEKREQNGAVRT